MEERILDLIKLKANLRETTGKGPARRLRQNKAIPAIVYGAKNDPVMLSLSSSEFDKIIREHGSTGLFFNLDIDGDTNKKKIVMLKAVQMDTFSLNYLHIDLHEIDMDTKVTVRIPVEAIGESRGVKEGGIIQLIRRELDIVCKPADTPNTIKVDITDLDVGDAIHVEDIDLGELVEIPHEVDFTVITIVAPTAEEKEIDEDEDLFDASEAADADASDETDNAEAPSK